VSRYVNLFSTSTSWILNSFVNSIIMVPIEVYKTAMDIDYLGKMIFFFYFFTFFNGQISCIDCQINVVWEKVNSVWVNSESVKEMINDLENRFTSIDCFGFVEIFYRSWLIVFLKNLFKDHKNRLNCWVKAIEM